MEKADVESCTIGAGKIRYLNGASTIYAASTDRTVDGLHYKAEVHQAILSELFNMFCDSGHCCTVAGPTKEEE